MLCPLMSKAENGKILGHDVPPLPWQGSILCLQWPYRLHRTLNYYKYLTPNVFPPACQTQRLSARTLREMR